MGMLTMSKQLEVMHLCLADKHMPSHSARSRQQYEEEHVMDCLPPTHSWQQVTAQTRAGRPSPEWTAPAQVEQRPDQGDVQYIDGARVDTPH